MIRVGLFGTTCESKWREELIDKLNLGKISYFNPVVDDWDESCIKNENREKKIDDLLLFVITPEMRGVYSIAEVTHASDTIKQRCIFCPLKEYNGKSFDESQWRSFKAICKLLKKNDTRIFYNLDDVAKYINTFAKNENIF